MSATLTHWTKRVIEIKSQELDVVQYYALSVQRWDVSRLSVNNINQPQYLGMHSRSGRHVDVSTLKKLVCSKIISYWNAKVDIFFLLCVKIITDVLFMWRYSPPDFSSMAGREACPGTSTSDSSTQGGSSSSYNYHYCLGKMARKVYGGEVTTTGAWCPWMVGFQSPISVIGIPSHLTKPNECGFSHFRALVVQDSGGLFFFLKDCATCSNIRIVSRYLLCSSIQNVSKKNSSNAGETPCPKR